MSTLKRVPIALIPMTLAVALPRAAAASASSLQNKDHSNGGSGKAHLSSSSRWRSPLDYGDGREGAAAAHLVSTCAPPTLCVDCSASR